MNIKENMRKVRARAPGKLIISGEHAVVYGKPAIAMAIDKCTTTELCLLPQQKTINYSSSLLQHTINTIIKQFNINLSSGIDINTDAEIPIGCGMGSSAAAIISVMHAMTNLFSLELSLDQYLPIARDIENLQHGISI